MTEKIENLIAQMTLEEKVSMLAGASHWATVPVERLGFRPSRSRMAPTVPGAARPGAAPLLPVSRWGLRWQPPGTPNW